MRIVFQEHISKRKQPINIENKDILLFEHEFEKKIRNSHYILILNGFILNGIIIKFGTNLKQYLSYALVHPILSNKKILKKVFLFRRGFTTIEKGVWIIDNMSLGYFHWLTDALPRLLASKRDGEQYQVLLPESYKQFSYISESLSFLGEQIIYYNAQTPLKVKKLLVTSHTADTGNYNPILINELRNKFLYNNTNKSDRKVFISRLKAPRRKIINEEEVINLLKLYGYEIHCFEDYTFKKQIEIMSQTKHLIGLHGAGLTNMLFMKENSKVLELRNLNDNHNNCYFSLASELNLNYFYQLNQGNRNETYSADIIVDINELRKNIEKMI
ncbi:glycosyltransferase family 61 protein [Flavobacterium sp.]|uniref:glycosyltransferase family 61 protein n=1 Tax=Flavobacterium sp. TaxID=239 RepID=UPI00286E14E6|nr:glycosyltransferase family 61 protein [Flavobacterium sp.]